MLAMSATATTKATFTCPECGFTAVETMPTNACQFFYTCTSCRTLLKPLPGDCCVFCSYSDQVCPPKQSGDECC
jgi:LSD1 subclass zinc finger protein